MKKENASSQSRSHPWLDKKLFWKISPAWLIISLLMGVSLLLHLVNIGAIGDGNLYYTAAVKSMLQSWGNFFFAAAEPGGSVTVDKPPLGLWIEALSASIFGVNGFAVSLPNILAGIFSIPLLFHLVKKHFGSLAGITSGAIYVITPIVLVTDRNNTIDGMLVFTLLLAAWAFIKATDTGKLRHLLIGSVLVGLGFNIKMLQAYLVLPAFLLLFLLAAKIGWGKRILHISIALIVILSVSLSWAVIVDLTPIEDRPYVGSSENNTVMELIVGHNGLARLFGKNRSGYPPQNTDGPRQPPANFPQNAMPPHNPPGFNGGQPPANQPPQGARPPQQPGGNPFSKETGSPGIFRLFQAPLGKEMSWLLPFALFGMVMLAFSAPMSLENMSSTHKGIILWGGWMLTCLIFFSMADFFHAYYMIMLAPPLSALVGAGLSWFTNLKSGVQWKKGALVFALLLTLIFQVYLALEFITFTALFFLPIGVFIICAAVLLFTKKLRTAQILSALLFISVLLIPFWWTVQTVLIGRS
jgi:4-amino-4-deoxy-L-arabinose transferase-like glycosyltransferase